MSAWGAQTFWLDVTNIGLGVVTLACILIVGFGVVLELLPRLRRRAAATGDDHALFTPALGLTMADGGRRIEPAKRPLSWRRRPR